MRILKWVLAFVVLGVIVAATVPFWPLKSDYDEKAAETTFSGDQADLAKRGKYLAVAADCAACHQSPDGTPYAGGLPIDTPFGVIYGTNITPDKETGIGNYGAKDLFHAVVDGQGKKGTWLYPAMPFTSYHSMRQEDSDAIFAFLMTQVPVARQNRNTELGFPFNQRWLLSYWNLVNPKVSLPESVSAEDANGAYLTDVLGHCQECHTPRNLMGGLKLGQAYEGSDLAGGIQGPSLTPDALAERGWTAQDLRNFLSTGMSSQGTMTLEMYPVLQHSTQYLTDDDIAGIQAYLTGDEPLAPQPVKRSQPVDAAEHARGRDTYVAVCAGCHGIDGEGKPHIAPPMVSNTSLRLSNTGNLLSVLMNGVPEQYYPNGEVMQEMPGFSELLSKQEMVDLTNYMRLEWGGRSNLVTLQDINEFLN